MSTKNGSDFEATTATTRRIVPTAISTWAAVLLLGILVIQAGEAVVSRFNPDEFQFLHSAWMLNHGYLPYRDFWSNNPPLFISILRPLVASYDEDASTVFLVARLAMWVINLGLFGLVAVLAARGQKRSWSAGLYAALLLSINRTVLEPMAQIRHDSLTLICELFALVLLARGIEFRRSRDVLVAGAALGCALALSPKALFGLSGLTLGYLVYLLSSPTQIPRYSGRMYPLALLLAGTIGTFGLVIAVLLPFDVWSIMVNRVFLESANNPDRFSPITTYLLTDIASEPAVWVVMLGGVGIAVHRWWLGPMRHPHETFLLVVGLWFGVTYLFFMPSPYRQSALPFVAVLSIFGGRWLATGIDNLIRITSGVKLAAYSTVLAVVVSWIAIWPAWGIIRDRPPFQRRNAEEIRMIQYVLSLTEPTDAIFDGRSAYIFRPQASYYGSLVEAILISIRQGELVFDIPQRCEDLRCKVIIADPRIVRLPPKVLAWIRANYIFSPEFPDVLLRRTLEPPSERSDR